MNGDDGRLTLIVFYLHQLVFIMTTGMHFSFRCNSTRAKLFFERKKGGGI